MAAFAARLRHQEPSDDDVTTGSLSECAPLSLLHRSMCWQAARQEYVIKHHPNLRIIHVSPWWQLYDGGSKRHPSLSLRC